MPPCNLRTPIIYSRIRDNVPDLLWSNCCLPMVIEGSILNQDQGMLSRDSSLNDNIDTPSLPQAIT